MSGSTDTLYLLAYFIVASIKPSAVFTYIADLFSMCNSLSPLLQALVEKDWLAFGHPFAERMGVPTVAENVGSQYELLRQPSLGNLNSSPGRNSLGQSGTSSNSSGQSQTSNNSSPILLQVACGFCSFFLNLSL
jgi:hypothetical protein